MLIIYFVGVVLWIVVGAVLTETHDQEWGNGLFLGVAIVFWPAMLAYSFVAFFVACLWELGKLLGKWLKKKGVVKCRN